MRVRWTARSVLLGLPVALLLLLPAAAGAQIGIPNTPLIPPNSPLPDPFGTQPHPFNDHHPVQPWSGLDRILRVFEVPARMVFIPMETAQPGSLPATVEWRQVTLPGYVVSETTRGWLIHGHWGVQPVGTAYYWTWRDTYFVAR